MNTQSQTAEYNGLCAFALSLGKTDVKGGNQHLIINGKKYVFSNPLAKMLFKVLPNRVEKANNAWNNN